MTTNTNRIPITAVAILLLCSCSGDGFRHIGNSFTEASNAIRTSNSYSNSYYTSAPAVYNTVPTYSTTPQYKTWQETQFENDMRHYTELQNYENQRVINAVQGIR